MVLGIVCILTTSIVPASASYSIFNKRLAGGIGNYDDDTYREYWISSNLNTDLVTRGIDGWNHSSDYSGVFSELNFKETSDRPSSIMDYYSKTLPDGILGITEYYRSDGRSATKNIENWAFCRVYITTAHMSDFEYIVTSAHEMGHVLGFSECNSEKDSIMCQLKYSSEKYDYPIAADINKLNTMY